jgi:NAD(P) transhydrogenase subunit beta
VTWAQLLYTAAALCFVAALRMLSSPKTAVQGNLVGAAGMLIAVVATLLIGRIVPGAWILGGIAVGSAIGVVMALAVPMTGMPQMVALLNGFGGAASAAVAAAELIQEGAAAQPVLTVPVVLSTLIGCVTFTGSVVAFAKLQELMPGQPLTYPLQQPVNFLLALAVVALCVWVVREPGDWRAFGALNALSLLLGVLVVLPIGGADMPVVISLLNSYSGLAACATGFVLGNFGLIISGSLVGASGIILTAIMCKAMNRSLANVLFGAFGKVQEGAAAAGAQGTVRGYSVEDVVNALEGAQRVIVVPGYGMAVAQAQHAVRELADLLKARGVEVCYAIHPVAGRMPGHMNVLLAEANVPYEELLEMEQVNPLFPQTDVALVVGANDITNPAARSNLNSPLYGMPILDVDKARVVVVLKRSMRPGFAGVENELYLRENTMMLFGDARESLMKLTAALKAAA